MRREDKPENTGYPFLFSSLKFSGYTTKNRLVALPVHTGFAYPDGHVSPWMVKWYDQVAKTGVGMVIVANAAVSKDGVVSRFNLRVDKDEFIPGLTRLADTIKQHGSIACLQLNHAGRFAKTKQPLLPSPITSENLAFNIDSMKGFMAFFPFEKRFNLTRYFFNQIRSWRQAMTDQERKRIIEDFSSAALRANIAGFDMVELHGANGYLLCQYLSGFTNQIKKKYGPDFKQRIRLPLKIIQAVKNRLPKRFPIGFRILLREWVPGGIELSEALAFARLLEKEKVSYLSASAGTYNSIFNPHIMKLMTKKVYLHEDMAELNKNVDIPTIISGRIINPGLADTVIQNGTADLIGLGRPLIVDPRWVEKAGKKEKITVCLNCNQCLKQVVLEKGLSCIRWPRLLRKRNRLDHQLLTRSFKNLWVISAIEDIQTFKKCWPLLDPEKNIQLFPTILILKNPMDDDAINIECQKFIEWVKFKIDPLSFSGAPKNYVIRDHLQNWEDILLKIIVNKGHGRVFMASNKKEPWRARMLYKQREKVMVMLGLNLNLHRIMVPVDFSPATLLVLKYLEQTILGKNRFHICFVHVKTGRPDPGAKPEKRWEKFKRIAGMDEDIPLQVVESSSDVVTTLIDLIRINDYGTIVMGKRGIAEIKRWLLGSVSAGVLGQLTNQTLFLID